MKFKISLAQYPILFFKSKTEWLNSIEIWFQKAKLEDSQIIVFPEYGSLDLTSLLSKESQNNLALQLIDLQNLHSFFLDSFVHLAAKHSLYVVAPSFPLKIDGHYFNRSYFISPNQNYSFQDKIHMTRFENEDWGISASETSLKVFDTSLGKIGIQICFDIEFPWAASLLATSGVQHIIVPSCTEGLSGMNRVHTGAKARALENQIYVSVSHTVGESIWSPAVDKNTGTAAVFTPSDLLFPDDGILASGTLNQSEILNCELDLALIDNVRSHGQVFNFKSTLKYPWTSYQQKNLNIEHILL